MKQNIDDGYLVGDKLLGVFAYSMMVYFLFSVAWTIYCGFWGDWQINFNKLIHYFKIFLFVVPVIEINLYILYKFKLSQVMKFVYLINNNKAIYKFIYNDSSDKFKIDIDMVDFGNYYFSTDQICKTNTTFIYPNKSDSSKEYCCRDDESKLTRSKFIQSINEQNLLPFKLTPSYLFYGLYHIAVEEHNSKLKFDAFLDNPKLF